MASVAAAPILGVSKIAHAATPPKRLIIIANDGAFDGLHFLPPKGEHSADYQFVAKGASLNGRQIGAARPSLAVAHDQVVDVGDARFGFHPGLEPLKQLYLSRELGAISGIL